jgi:Ni/Co efflux regulator RcnB
MKKLIALMLVASFTGAVIAQQAPQTPAPAQVNHMDKDGKDKKKHHHHRHHKDEHKADVKK